MSSAVDQIAKKTVVSLTRPEKRLVLFTLFIVATCSYVDKNIIGVLLEQIKIEFRASDTVLGLLSGFSFALFYASFGIPIARLADRGNRKTIVWISLVVWSVLTALCGLSRSIIQLATLRFGVGAGEAGIMPAAQSLLADTFAPAERASAIGIFMMSSSGGYAIGLILGGYLAQHFGWRAAFLVVGGLGLTLVPFAQRYLVEYRKSFLPATHPALTEDFLASARALFRKTSYWYLLGGIIIYWLMGYGSLVFIVSLMIRVHGLNVGQAGSVFGVISAVGALFGNLCGGRLTDRMGRERPSWIPLLAGIFMLASVPVYEAAFVAPDMLTMGSFLLVAYIVLTAVMPPMFAALHLICGSPRRAVTVAITLFFANLIGLGLGPLMAGALSDHWMSAYGSGEGLRHSLMATVLVLIPGGLSMLLAARYLRADIEE